MPNTPKRIQMSRQSPWRAENPDAVIVARPSKWGNPYRVSPDLSAADAVALFRDLIDRFSRSTADPRQLHDGLGVWDRDILATIQTTFGGRDLACWCPLDQPCHADVLIELANLPAPSTLNEGTPT